MLLPQCPLPTQGYLGDIAAKGMTNKNWLLFTSVVADIRIAIELFFIWTDYGERGIAAVIFYL